MGRHFVDTDNAGFRKVAQRYVELINHATRNIPPESMRMHVCWGNYEGPHHHDIPFREIVDIVLTARPASISIEAANPRHEHEWAVWQDVKLPDDKVLIPGVIDSTTNYIEHPELIAQRIVNFARVVGRENVIAGSDCGFGTFAALPLTYPRISWAKLRALSEGAALATKELWR
jgi:5-methyltetrahydropteroyltriglutamate--homocysteine methyltransferase